jgi:hypothetical protein
MNPCTDRSLPVALRNALSQAGVDTREKLEELVRSGRLMHLRGVGTASFRAAEAWLARTDPAWVTLDAHTDFWWLLLGGIRYAMGRMTMAPGHVQDLALRYRKHLRPEQVRQIVDEVERELEIEVQRPGRLGMDCDVRGWREFAAKMREHVATGAAPSDRST